MRNYINKTLFFRVSSILLQAFSLCINRQESQMLLEIKFTFFIMMIVNMEIFLFTTWKERIILIFIKLNYFITQPYIA